MTTVVGVLGRGIVAADQAVVRADDLGLTRGDGCFESCRVRTDPDGHSVVERLDAHLARLARSLAALDLTVDIPACRELIGLVATAWSEPGEAVVKLMVTRGPDASDLPGSGAPTVLATLRPIGADALRQRRDGVRVASLTRGTPADAYADAPWLLGGVKALSYALNMAALREAVRRGAEDALWVAVDGTVLEAPTATVVWARGRRLATTPTGATGILAGTTMAALFDGARAAGFAADVETVGIDDLRGADAIWLVSAVRGVAEVIELDGVARPGPAGLTQQMNGFAEF